MKLFVNLQYDFEYKGFVADCPSLPGCMSQGKTKRVALRNIQEAIRGYIEVLKKHHETSSIEAVPAHYVEVKV